MTRMIQIGSMTLTEDEARRAGVLPEQIRARAARQARLVEALGRTDAVARQTAGMLRHATRAKRWTR